MQEAIQKLKDLVDQSDNIVFFGGAVFPRNPAFRISAAPTDCTTSSGNIRLR